MHRLQMAGTLLGLLLLASGCATCRTPRCSKPRCEKPRRVACDTGNCGKESCGESSCGNDKCDRNFLVPYRNACQKRDFSGNFLGRLARWATYRPLCANTPCDCAEGPRCHPPLYTYFQPSKYNRCYEPVDCGGGACRPSWFGGIFRRNKCGSCDDGCGPERDCWTLKISLPRVSFTRDGGACGTGCNDNACGNKCMTLPRPISNRACENSSAGCGTSDCGNGGRRGLLGGRGGCGVCGLRGRLGNNINNKCCNNTPDVANVDLNHISILSPQAVTDVKAGNLNKIPKAETNGAPKMADGELPGAK